PSARVYDAKYRSACMVRAREEVMIVAGIVPDFVVTIQASEIGDHAPIELVDDHRTRSSVGAAQQDLATWTYCHSLRSGTFGMVDGEDFLDLHRCRVYLQHGTGL